MRSCSTSRTYRNLWWPGWRSRRHPVLDNAPARDLAAQGRALNLVPEDEAARRLSAGRARCTPIPRTPWRGSSTMWATRACAVPRHPAVQGQGAHARGAETARSGPVLPGEACWWTSCSNSTSNDWKRRSVLKPSVGFCSMGVHAVHDRDDWQRALSDIAQNASAWHDLYPESVVGTGSFMLEGCVEGHPSTRWTPTSTRREPPMCSTSCGTTLPALPTRATAST